MYINLPKSSIKLLEDNGHLQNISLWDTLSGAMEHYNKQEGRFTAYVMEQSELNSAYATPVKVFLIKGESQ